MKILIDRIKRIRGIKQSDIEEMILIVMDEQSDVAIRLNQDQLERGYDSMAERLKPYASSSYARYKKTLNPRGVTDLKLTGRFWSNMYLDTNKFPAHIDSRDSKRNDLVSKYGSNIFGLQKTRMAQFVSACKPGIQKGFKRFVS